MLLILEKSNTSQRYCRRAIFSIFVVSFVVRIIGRYYLGAEAFWINGYTFFFDLAHNLATGKGIVLADGSPTAVRVPGYPAFLAAVTPVCSRESCLAAPRP